ncbi:hypothetical protein ACOTJG_26205 [Achromobacter xylosoxidans]|jgi:hypothetical protein
MHEFKPQAPIVLAEGDRYLAEGDLVAVPLRAMPGGLVEFVLVRPLSKEEICNAFRVDVRELEPLQMYRFSAAEVLSEFALTKGQVAEAQGVEG